MRCSECNIEKERKEFHKSYWKDYAFIKKCKCCVKKNNKRYYKENKKQLNKKSKEYRESNKERYNAYCRNKYKNDIEYKIISLLRRRMRAALKEKNKSESTKELLGCSIKKLRQHLELQFEEEMTWDNHGEWHIDHIKPCALFDLTDEEQQKECFHYSNLQPLWAQENLSKGKTFKE